jgi:hypothetical protein
MPLPLDDLLLKASKCPVQRPDPYRKRGAASFKKHF